MSCLVLTFWWQLSIDQNIWKPTSFAIFEFSDRKPSIFTFCRKFLENSSKFHDNFSKSKVCSKYLRNISICNECSQIFDQVTCRHCCRKLTSIASLQEESQPFSRNFSKFESLHFGSKDSARLLLAIMACRTQLQAKTLIQETAKGCGHNHYGEPASSCLAVEATVMPVSFRESLGLGFTASS
jgi:hypothetical protein